MTSPNLGVTDLPFCQKPSGKRNVKEEESESDDDAEMLWLQSLRVTSLSIRIYLYVCTYLSIYLSIYLYIYICKYIYIHTYI